MQQYNNKNPNQEDSTKKARFKIVVYGLALILVIFTAFLFLRKEAPVEAPTPLASPPPPVILPPGKDQASQSFVWSNITIPEPTGNLSLYTITRPFVAFSELSSIISFLGFVDSDKTVDDPAQKVWSDSSQSLSMGTSPQYFTYSAKEMEGASLDKNRLFALFTSQGEISIKEPFVDEIIIPDRVAGTSSAIEIITHNIDQKIDNYPLISSSKLHIGSMTFNKSTDGLMSIRISSGYRSLKKEGSARPLTKEELISRAGQTALMVDTDNTISDRLQKNTTPQRVKLESIEIVYYNNSNDVFVRPGYLLSGINQSNQKVVYFVPML